MAVPVVAGSATTTDLATSSTFTVNLPASISSGDVLYVLIGYEGSVAVVNTPSGWTAEEEILNDSTKMVGRLYLFSRRADGGEGATQDFTMTGTRYKAAIAMRVTGVDAGVSDLTNQLAELADTNDTVSHTGPSVTTTESDCLVLHAFLTTHVDGAGSNTMTTAGSETEIADTFANGFTEPSMAAYREDAASAGTYSCTVNFDANASQCAMIVWAINAAAAAPQLRVVQSNLRW